MGYAAGLLGDDEDEEDTIRFLYGLGEGQDGRFSNPMGWLSTFIGGSYRPLGYDMRNDEFDDERFTKDLSRLSIRVLGELVNQLPAFGIGMMSSTTIGGSLVEDGLTSGVGDVSGVDLGTGELAGVNPGSPENELDGPIDNTVYSSTKWFRNNLANRSYFMLGLNHMMNYLYYDTNAGRDTSIGDKSRLFVPMLPFLPRETRYATPAGWSNFTDATDGRVWHNSAAQNRKKKKKSQAPSSVF